MAVLLSWTVTTLSAGADDAALAAARTAAEQGSVPAMLSLGYFYADLPTPLGRPPALDPVESARWLSAAAAKGEVRAVAALGMLHLQTDDLASAVYWLRQASKQGDRSSMLTLGRLYLAGRGIPKDPFEGFRLTRAAVDAGYLMGLYDLANLYRRGIGTQKDIAEAIRLYTRAAELKWTPAMLALGAIHLHGEGVPADPKTGMQWIISAAANGDVIAVNEIAGRAMSEARQPSEWKRIREAFDFAARRGNADSMYGLAVIYANGLGVPAQPKLAAEWMMKALRGGSLFAIEEMTAKPGEWPVEFGRQLQGMMLAAGVYSGPADGRFTNATNRAVVELVKRGL